MDVCVTVPRNFTHPAAPGKKGLAAWLAEGDAPGEPWSGEEWIFTARGKLPMAIPGDRFYVVCQGILVGYAPLIRAMFDRDVMDRFEKRGAAYFGPVAFIRRGGAVGCTIDEKIVGFRGWRYRWWDREDEKPLDLSRYL